MLNLIGSEGVRGWRGWGEGEVQANSQIAMLSDLVLSLWQPEPPPLPTCPLSNEPYQWQPLELKPQRRLCIIGNFMVDHYVLLYIIVHMIIFLRWLL